MIGLWCEYDLGQEGLLFHTKEAARAWIKNAFETVGFDFSFKEFENENLFGYEIYTIKD